MSRDAEMSREADTADDLSRKAAQRAYDTAVRLLGRRDHSIAELTKKLRQREHDDDAIQVALDELASANYVNDERYAELYAEQRMNRGYGPLSIRSKLAERGVDSHHVRQALDLLEIDWAEQAGTVLAGRFTPAEIADTGQRSTARIARYLQSRGYSSSDALRALQRQRREIDNR